MSEDLQRRAGESDADYAARIERLTARQRRANEGLADINDQLVKDPGLAGRVAGTDGNKDADK